MAIEYDKTLPIDRNPERTEFRNKKAAIAAPQQRRGFFVLA